MRSLAVCGCGRGCLQAFAADGLSVMFCVIFGSVGGRVDVNRESEQIGNF